MAVNYPPKISAVMSVFNAENSVAPAIESILNQSYSNFEFIIVNDGSTDNSEGVIRGFSAEDARIMVISRENKGLIASLNEGIARARGEYIVRMDADDVSLPSRFAMQLGAIENLNVDVVGGSIRFVGGVYDGQVENYPLADADIKFRMLMKSSLAHPTVFAKAKILSENPYSSTAVHAEDYELWTRLALKGAKFANIQDVCLLYSVGEEQITQVYSEQQFSVVREIAANYGKKMYEISPDLMRSFRTGVRQGAGVKEVMEWSLVLARVAKENGVTPEWVEKALFATASKCHGSGLRLFRFRRMIQEIDTEFVSNRLAMLYACKAFPFSNAEWLIEWLKRHRQELGIRW